MDPMRPPRIRNVVHRPQQCELFGVRRVKGLRELRVMEGREMCS